MIKEKYLSTSGLYDYVRMRRMFYLGYKMNLKFKVISLLLLINTLKFSEAIDVRSAEESPCFTVANPVDPNDTWVASVDKWYYPLASRLDFYRSAHDLLETDYENIPEYSLYYDSCLEWTINSEGYTLMGYNGKWRQLRTTPIAQGTADFVSEWSQGMVGRAYTTLTDNKTYIFTAACFEDNQMSWNVFSTTKTLSEDAKNEIIDHAQSLGYNMEYLTELRYDSCKKSQRNEDNLAAEKVALSPSRTRELQGDKSSKNHGFFFCSACLRVCPNLGPKNSVADRYFKKLARLQDGKE